MAPINGLSSSDVNTDIPPVTNKNMLRKQKRRMLKERLKYNEDDNQEQQEDDVALHGDTSSKAPVERDVEETLSRKLRLVLRLHSLYKSSTARLTDDESKMTQKHCNVLLQTALDSLFDGELTPYTDLSTPWIAGDVESSHFLSNSLSMFDERAHENTACTIVSLVTPIPVDDRKVSIRDVLQPLANQLREPDRVNLKECLDDENEQDSTKGSNITTASTTTGGSTTGGDASYSSSDVIQALNVPHMVLLLILLAVPMPTCSIVKTELLEAISTLAKTYELNALDRRIQATKKGPGGGALQRTHDGKRSKPRQQVNGPQNNNNGSQKYTTGTYNDNVSHTDKHHTAGYNDDSGTGMKSQDKNKVKYHSCDEGAGDDSRGMDDTNNNSNYSTNFSCEDDIKRGTGGTYR
eukprot:Lankesteria_metandrocarpae@DN768_c1_g1_i1.p1